MLLGKWLKDSPLVARSQILMLSMMACACVDEGLKARSILRLADSAMVAGIFRTGIATEHNESLTFGRGRSSSKPRRSRHSKDVNRPRSVVPKPHVEES